MKKMRILIVGLVICVGLCLCTKASAENIDMSGLNEAQKAQVIAKIAEMKTAPVLTVENASQWVEFDKNVGLAFASTAKELGIAADQFLKTTTGKITIFLIIWKVLGKDLLGAFCGIIFLLIFVPMWTYYFQRLCVKRLSRTIERINDDSKKEFVHHYEDVDTDGTKIMMLIILFCLIGFCTMLIL